MRNDVHRARRSGQRRRAVAATEFALCLPIMLILVLGTIEACNAIFLKESLTSAAYEGARMAIRQGAINDDVQASCQQVLDNRGVQGSTISIDPSDITTVAMSSYITVTVSAPVSSNAILRGSFFQNQTLQGQATMMKEF